MKEEQNAKNHVFYFWLSLILLGISFFSGLLVKPATQAVIRGTVEKLVQTI